MGTSGHEWIESLGGPLVLVPEAVLPSWQGNRDPDAVITDYERACEISGPRWPSRTEIRWDLPGPVVLFDSVFAGSEIGEEHIRVVCEPGTHAIRTAYVELSPDVSLGLIRLTRVFGG